MFRLRRFKSFSHGIHPAEAKAATRHKPIRRFPFAPFLVLLLSQHAGRPAVPVVREGQEVVRGQPVARADGFVSAPIHAPATGVIRKIGHALDTGGRMAPAIILEPFPGSGQEMAWGQPVDLAALQPADIINHIRDMGMVGLGGAAFPAHVKFTPPEGAHIDTLLINGCECEPYLTADHRVMLEHAPEVLLGTWLVQKALGAGRAIIAIESNKPDAARVLRETLAAFSTGNGAGGGPGDGVGGGAGEGAEFRRLLASLPPDWPAGISVELLETKYPQGAEKMLTKALLNREIPSGGLPAHVGVMVSNVTTVAEIGTLLPHGQGLTERVISICGAGVERPGNYLMPVGTPLSFVLEHVGLRGEAREVIFGGPMMGKGVAFLETPVTKGVSGILVLDATESPGTRREYPCIKCAACVRACPMHLNPSTLGVLARNDAFEAMERDYHLMDCFECGCCSYVCPANIPLVQQFRVAKKVLRDLKAAS